MRRRPISKIEPGTKLGSTLKIPSPHPDVHYKLKLDEGTVLTEKHLKRLNKLNISKVPVEDSRTDDLDPFIYDKKVSEAEDEVIEEFSELTTKFEKDSLSAKDVNRLNEAVDSLIEALKGSELMAAFTTLKTHDSYTARHSLDVAKIAIQLVLEFEEELKKQLHEESGASMQYIYNNMIQDLGVGAMLHDIGKRHVADNILNKSAELNDEEWNKMQKHTVKGHSDLQQLNSSINAPVKVPSVQHHEKFDGSGYPRGLEGKDIHLFGRICAPADVYSALTSSRPYREGKPPAVALEIMESMQDEGPHFDPEIYEKFRKLVFPYPAGMEVTLSDGSQGVVCDVDEENPSQPTVRILSRNGSQLQQPVEVKVPNRPGELKITEPAVESDQLLTA
ncbi:MAG: HD-GYP domain-containing protein [bacterium]